jgi:hypothetical protein
MSKYAIIWRAGGTEDFQWHRSLAMNSEQADTRRAEIQAMGYDTAMVVDYELSVSVGLPDTYSPDENVDGSHYGHCTPVPSGFISDKAWSQ